MAVHVLALAVLVSLAGCAPRAASPPRRSGAGAGEFGTPRVAVLPFRTEGELGTRRERADKAEAPPAVGPEADEVGAEFARKLAVSLAERGFAVVDPDRVSATVARTAGRTYDPQLARRVATTLGAAFAVLGTVTRYQQREGTAWAVQRPASVGYEAALVRAADGAVLRNDRFDYTQRALSENLLDLPRFLEGGGRWLTREEIRDGALRDTAGRFAEAAAAVR